MSCRVGRHHPRDRRPSLRSACAALLVVLSAFFAPALEAQEAVPGLTVRSGVVAGANPTVAGVTASVGWTTPLYRERSGILWDSARVESRLEALVSPSFGDISAVLFVEPIVLFDLTIRAGVRRHDDDLGFGLAPLEGYDETGPSARGTDYDGRDATGTFITAAPRLKGAFGPIIATWTLSATRFDYRDVAADRLEEPASLATIAPTDTVVRSDLTALYQLPLSRTNFSATGLSWSSISVPDAPRDDQPVSQRLALVAVVQAPVGRLLVLEMFGGAGLYLTGEPIALERPSLLAALSLVYRPAR